MRVTYAEYSCTGPVRVNNEDCVGFCAAEDPEGGVLAAIADGVGGQAKGEVASRMAIDNALQIFGTADPELSAGELLWQIFKEANLAIYNAILEHPEEGRMATTLTATLVRDGEVTIGHVGDCRVYHIHEGMIKRITTDHSYVGLQLKLQLISEEEARTSEFRNLLTRCVGSRPMIRTDYYSFQVSPRDIIIQCSDGLYGSVSEEAMLEIILHFKPEQACEQLAQLAEKQGSKDNISIQILKIDDLHRSGARFGSGILKFLGLFL